MKIADTSGQDVLLTPKNNYKKYFFSVAVLLVAIAGFVLVKPTVNAWASSQTSVSTERLRFAVVERGEFIRDLSVQGKVVAAVSPRLYSPAQGTVTYMVEAGDSVQQGQVLAEIDSPELTNRLMQERASLQELKIKLDRQRIQAKKQRLENQKSVDLTRVALDAADREKRRADKAFSSSSISEIDYEKAQDELQYAQLMHEHAKQDAELHDESLTFEVQTKQLQVDRQSLLVEDLARQVDGLILRSPVNGIVGNLAVQQKNQVAINQAVMRVVDLTEFELEVAIPESYADDLAIGMDAEVGFNGHDHLATLVTISPEIINNQVTGRVRFAKTDSKGNVLRSPQGLRQNQRLTTRILIENKSNALMVQRGQFVESSNGSVAYVVRDNLAQRTPIRIGARSLANVEVLSGLEVGDTIIVSGTAQFHGADTVLITN